jgi:hypothetical protein
MRALRMHACGMRTRRSTSSRRSRNARSSTKSPTVTERSAACPRRSPRARTTLCAQCKVCAVLCRRLTAAQGCCAVWAVRTRLPTPLLLSPPVGSRHGRGLSDFLARQRSKTSSWTSISVRRARSVSTRHVDRHRANVALNIHATRARLACSTERLAHVHRRL